MAMLIFRASEKSEWQRVMLEMYTNTSYGELQDESMCALEEGRLPGNLGDTPEALKTGEGAGSSILKKPKRLAGCSAEGAACEHVLAHVGCGFWEASAFSCHLIAISTSPVVWACAGCVQRASCLLWYVYLVRHNYTVGSRMRLPWKMFVKAVHIRKVRNIHRQMAVLLRCCWSPALAMYI